MKKKLMIFTLCTMMALTAAACGKTLSNASKADASSENTQIPSPFTECDSMDKAAALVGFSLTAPDAIGSYSRNAILADPEDDKLLEIIYTDGSDENANQICIRKGTGDGDISGDYNEYSETSTATIENKQVTTRGTGEKIYVAFWSDGDYTFSIDADEAMTADTLQELVGAIQ